MDNRGSARNAKKPWSSDTSKNTVTSKLFTSTESHHPNTDEVRGMKGKANPKSPCNLKLEESKTEFGMKASSRECNVLVVSSTKPSCISASSVRDLKSKTEKVKKNGGNVTCEELNQDLLGKSYNIYLQSAASKILMNSSARSTKVNIDKQLAALQKRVNENLEMLEETKKSVDTVTILHEQTDRINFQINVMNSVEDEPAFTKGKSLTELMSEIEILKNQLSCKGIAVPKSRSDIASLQNATSQLMMSLDRISAANGHDKKITTTSLDGLQNITQSDDGLQTVEQSIAVDEPKVSACVLEEAVSKSVRSKLSD